MDTNLPQGEPSVGQYDYYLKKFGGIFFELVKVTVLALAIVVPIRYFLIQPFYVKGASMEPNFHDNEYLIINEITYRLAEPKRGDVVVFKYPRDPEQYFIKRVIGMPGESVKIDNGLVYLKTVGGEDYQLLDESAYLDGYVKTYPNLELTMNEGEYFLMGDNRSASLDSRIFGAVGRDFIVGKTWLRAWPLDKLSNFKDVNYDLNN
ncbi:MAG TPA: signal peptidase I [bacterium]|nr:signal peptidase I [bacterium]